MTDMTTESQMGRNADHRGSDTAEYGAYFALIFAVTLPFAFFTWTLAVLRGGGWPDKGPIARARTQANTITPMIFIP